MKLLCCIFLFILPCLALAAAAPLSRAGKLHSTDEKALLGLRGGRQASKSAGHSLRQQPIVALQASQSTHLHKAISKRKLKRAAKTSVTLRQHLSKMHRHMTRRLKRMFKVQGKKQRQHALTHKQADKVGICRNKLKWWIKVKKKCVKAYGKSSRWDKDRASGKCSEAWNACNTGFYAVCCTQPLGPKNMKAYCAKQNLTAGSGDKSEEKDKACQVQGSMSGVQSIMKNIKGAIVLMDRKDSMIVGLGPGPMPAPAPAQAPAVVLPPPGLTAASPAPAPGVPFLFGPVSIQSLATPPLLDRCAMLTELTRQAAEKIQDIESWAKQDGINEDDESPKEASSKRTLKDGIKGGSDKVKGAVKPPEDPEAKDPDLVFSVRSVIQAGAKLNALLKNSNFCNTAVDDDDDDDDDVEEDLKKDPEEDWEDDKDEDSVSDDSEAVAVNETAIMDLLNWGDDMNIAVDKFEKDVHPHGLKWWRYRYEYTVIESVVLAFSVMLLYFVMWLLRGVSFFEKSKFYKTGLPFTLHRYSWAYLVFHAASLMIMVTVAYMLYIPWGDENIFNMLAELIHDVVDGRANVPFLGYSWLYMVLDVQFQLFVCFALYSLFIVFVSYNYQKALEEWRDMGENAGEPSAKASRNAQLYASLEATMRKRVQNTPEYQHVFLQYKLRLPGVPRLEMASAGTSDFKLHLYLTDGLGKSLEYLVQVSLTTNIFLACSALVVAFLAHHYQVAFMYFLPGFLVIGIAMFTAGYFVTRHFRKLSDNDNHNTPSKYVTVHSYCRAIQIMLYCVLFSFSRLLLSNDIFDFYPRVYISALLGLAIVLVLLALVAGEAIKDTTCALILPPHVPPDQFERNLEHVSHWHTTSKCHECGVHQFPEHSSLSREWAGKKPAGDRKDGPPDSSRPQSFR